MSYHENVMLSPSPVILSEAKNLLLAQDKLREASLPPKYETLRSWREAPLSQSDMKQFYDEQRVLRLHYD